MLVNLIIKAGVPISPNYDASVNFNFNKDIFGLVSKYMPMSNRFMWNEYNVK